MLDRRLRRTGVLQEHGAAGSVVDELLAYAETPIPPGPRPSFPLPDEQHLDEWTRYTDEAVSVGTCETLRRHFVQLRIPIQEGISQETAYRDATLKGRFDAAEVYAPGLRFERPDTIDLTIHATIAGRIPVLVSGDRRDFTALVQAFSGRNEPAPVPLSMGACIVTGLINWGRVSAYRHGWTLAHPEATETGWLEEFRVFASRKELYQDRFIILSSGPYSGVTADDAEMAHDDWLARSLIIRREHECAHYFSHRVFGIMRNHIFDELVADFVGLMRAFATYRADLARRFLGLEDYPAPRAGSRIELYCGKLSPGAVQIVRSLAVAAIRNLERLAKDGSLPLDSVDGLGMVVFAVWQLSLEELASPDMPELVRARVP